MSCAVLAWTITTAIAFFSAHEGGTMATATNAGFDPANEDQLADPMPDRPPPPLKAIRQHCLECAGTAAEVAACPSVQCPVWLHRHGHRPRRQEAETVADVVLRPEERAVRAAEFLAQGGTGLRAIRRHCLDCSGGSPAEVKDCRHKICPLWPYRLGRNPNRGVSPERKVALLAQLATPSSGDA
jgi:hypothetical protein